MEQTINEIEINGVKYTRTDTIKESKIATVDGLQYVLVRTYSAGVHIGFLAKKDGKEVTLLNSRRIHYWKGACSVSQIALEGVKSPEDCRISVVVGEIHLTEAIETIPITQTAKNNLDEVKVWKS